MMKSNVINDKAVQARQIALNSQYQNIPRIVRDINFIIDSYENFYPSSTVKNGMYGKINLLTLTGHIQVTHPSKKRTCLLKIKITFPKDYPKSKPFVSAQNPNQQIHQRNMFYQKNGLARYDRSSQDNKLYLFLDFYEIKTWGVNSDILKLFFQIQKKFNQNFPWIPKQHVKDYGTKQSYTQNNINPGLKKQVQKVEIQAAQLESDFDVLNATRKQIILKHVSYDAALQEMQIKSSQLKGYTNYFQQIKNKLDPLQLDQNSIDKFLKLSSENQKILELSSQKQALEQCLNYLKQQLKSGLKIADIKDPLKRVYEDMFVNQVNLNQL